MNPFWRVAPWITRLPLALAVVLFLLLAGQWLVDPTHVAVLTESSVVLPSRAAITNMRGTGALFVPLAGILVTCLVSRERILLGLRLLTTIVAGAFAVRLCIVALDGMTPLQARILRVEVAFAILSAAGLVLETVRREREARVARQEPPRESAGAGGSAQRAA
jgi:hypothetical protein